MFVLKSCLRYITFDAMSPPPCVTNIPSVFPRKNSLLRYLKKRVRHRKFIEHISSTKLWVINAQPHAPCGNQLLVLCKLTEQACLNKVYLPYLSAISSSNSRIRCLVLRKSKTALIVIYAVVLPRENANWEPRFNNSLISMTSRESGRSSRVLKFVNQETKFVLTA